MTRPVVGSTARTTGSTDARIVSARRCFSSDERELFDEVVRYLIPPDHRIVAVADLKRIRTIFAWSVADHGATEEDQLLLTRINALIGGDA